MVAGLVFPDLYGESIIDLKQNFYAHRGRFFALALALVMVSVCQDLVLHRNLAYPMNLTFHGIFGATLLTGVFARRERYHNTLVIFGMAVHSLYRSPFLALAISRARLRLHARVRRLSAARH